MLPLNAELSKRHLGHEQETQSQQESNNSVDYKQYAVTHDFLLVELDVDDHQKYTIGPNRWKVNYSV